MVKKSKSSVLAFSCGLIAKVVVLTLSCVVFLIQNRLSDFLFHLANLFRSDFVLFRIFDSWPWPSGERDGR